MAEKQEAIRSSQIQGLRYLDLLMPLLDELHEVGCQRDKAGTRKLHYDQYCLLVLLFLFNPVLRSLRALQQASELEKVRRKLGVGRTSLGSFSEATDVFDPDRLTGIIGQLLSQLPQARQVGRGHLSQVLTAVDGTIVQTLGSLAQAAYMRDKQGKTHSAWRFHTHFEIDRSVPVRMDVTTARNVGKNEERNQLRRRLEPDRCYVLDRWYGDFLLWNQIVAAGSSYVCRIRDNSNLQRVVEERPVTVAARKAGVLRDLVVHLGRKEKDRERPDHPVRVILIQTTPHKRTGRPKGGTAGPASDGILRIATNLLDVPAEVIADIYKHRWLIELFFRFFKHILGCRHLLSTDPVGIQIQAYCAIIACLLIHLWTGGKPTLRTYEMICLYLQGWASLKEVKAHLDKLKPSA
ncbi:MAG TPA: IS4 family transposase [Candidatus Acidoferrum sp.]|nr:IS4 family transposase [Candidatus Acidoferrum sp.]